MVSVIDVSTPANPSQVGSYDTGDGVFAGDVAVSEPPKGEYWGHIFIIDISGEIVDLPRPWLVRYAFNVPEDGIR